jgi:hypothetical protein
MAMYAHMSIAVSMQSLEVWIWTVCLRMMLSAIAAVNFQ